MKFSFYRVILLLFVFSSVSSAATLTGTYNFRDGFHWHSGVAVGNAITPSIWEIPNNIPTAERLIPGGIGRGFDGNHIIQLSDGRGNTEDLTISVSGMEYMLYETPTLLSGSGGTTSINGRHVTVRGRGIGLADLQLSTSGAVAPFSHYRPMVNAELGPNPFDKKPSGTYTATWVYNFQYDYYRNGVRIRNTLTNYLNFIVEVNTDKAVSIRVISDPPLSQNLTQPGNLLSGEATHIVAVEGQFSNGVNITLRNQSAGYFLNPVTTTVTDTNRIPYSVYCIECLNNNLIIDNGTDALSGRTAYLNTGNTTEQIVQFRIFFENKNYDELETDTYNGQFMLYFEANI